MKNNNNVNNTIGRIELEYTEGIAAPVYMSAPLDIDNNFFVKHIREIGDKQGKITNVKADMTDWQLFDLHKAYHKLSLEIINTHLKYIIKPNIMGQFHEHWLLLDMWGNIYRKGDYTMTHNHEPATYSFIYYVQVPKGSAQLYLNDFDISIEPVVGKLLIFPAHINHTVPKQRVSGDRISIAGNMAPDFKRNDVVGVQHSGVPDKDFRPLVV